MALRARILCRVVDNLGDAGVCWRLARQLVQQAGWRVRLTIDRPELLTRFGADARDGVQIEAWPADAGVDLVGARDDVLISAFGCEPPAALRDTLAGAPRRPLWVQLEYLSAESWVAGCHGLRSTKPSDGAVEYFFYPGFDERTGGLLREHGLGARRLAFIGTPAQREWLAARGIERRADERLLTLFCYPDAPLQRWFALLAAGEQPIRVLVPETVADSAIALAFGVVPAPGQVIRSGRLILQRIAFLDHDDYDRLLWSADLNFVRGEDSWVRAHWAVRPFIWQPYVQQDGAHLVKLEAFLARLQAGAAVDEVMRAWSGAARLDAAWPAFIAQLDARAPAFAAWSAGLAAQADLVTRLVQFCRQRL